MKPYCIYPEQYQQQLSKKVALLQQQFDTLQAELATTEKHITLNVPSIEIFSSPDSHYRMRAEFKIWHDGEAMHYAMHDRETKERVFLQEFPVASKTINQLMPLLIAALKENTLLRKKLFQVEFLSTLKNDTLITLIYHRPLDQDWIDAITPLKNKLGVNIVGRSRKQKIILNRDYVNEELSVNNKTYYYQQNEGSFTQPNAIVCESMLTWAVNNSKHISNNSDLLELYCGNGNFTLPLAQNFNHVVATEISKSSVNAAKANIAKNNIDNITIVRMSSEEFAQAMDKVRLFKRLKEIDLDSYQFSTILVDPPRAGLDDHTISIVQGFENIIYISCNPATLMDNLKTICHTHQIIATAAFDQFPYTKHLEAGVILKRR